MTARIKFFINKFELDKDQDLGKDQKKKRDKNLDQYLLKNHLQNKRKENQK